MMEVGTGEERLIRIHFRGLKVSVLHSSRAKRWGMVSVTVC